MSATLVDAQATSQAHDDDLVHITCCDNDLALCGTDVSAAAETDEDWTCVVCRDLVEAPCTSGCDW